MHQANDLAIRRSSSLASATVNDAANDVGAILGAVIVEVVVDCASCGEPFALDVDTSAGPEQSYFEDCPVCCRPMEVFVRSRPGEVLSISVSAD